MTDSTNYKLTQFSHGAGCGCKIAPAVLDKILHNSLGKFHHIPDKNLLVGYDKKDDAAVYDIGDGRAIISTTDFFMPIVDDAYDFGRIASVNAISDVYAMGGKPLLAIAILGWPIDKLPAEEASKVIEGARSICAEAGIPLAGGHSIDNPEPLFGLAVTGEVPINHLRRNSTATANCELFITKPLGIGILTTARKKGLVAENDLKIAVDSMLQLNRAGYLFGQQSAVMAMTDITGFGLLGHLGEMADGSGLSAEINFTSIPVFPNLEHYITQKCIPGGTARNWNSYNEGIIGIDEYKKTILCDPQTSGGLLVAVDANGVEAFLKTCTLEQIPIWSIGRLYAKNSIRIAIKS